MRRRWIATLSLSLAAAFALWACGDQSSSPSPTGLAAPRAPTAILNDGSRDGGNADFFFLPPLVPNPSSHPNFDAGRFVGTWKPVVQLCRLKPNPDDGCATGWLRTYTTEVKVSLVDEHYQVNVDTREAWATEGLYRARVALVREDTLQLGFIDLGLMPNQQAVKNLRTQDVVGLQDGRTVPLKFRIEQGASVAPTSTDYKEQVVTNAGGIVRTVDEATGQPGGAILSFAEGWLGTQASEVVVTVEKINTTTANPCTVQVGQLLQTSDCWRVKTYPDIATVQATVIVAFCPAIAPTDARYDAQTMYKYDAGPPSTLRELPGAVAPAGFTCPTATASLAPRPGVLGALERGIARVGSGLSRVFGPNTAYAIDAGWGGRMVAGDEAFSDFFWGIPLQVTTVSGNAQSGVAGTPLPQPLVVRVAGTHDGGTIPIPNIEVRAVSLVNGAVNATSATTDASGLASFQFTPAAAGAASVTFEITSIGTSTSVTMTATGTSAGPVVAGIDLYEGSTTAGIYQRQSATVDIPTLGATSPTFIAQPLGVTGAPVAVPCTWTESSPNLSLAASPTPNATVIVGEVETPTTLDDVTVTCGGVSRTLLASVHLPRNVGSVDIIRAFAFDTLPSNELANGPLTTVTLFTNGTAAFTARPTDLSVPTFDLTNSGVACGFRAATPLVAVSPSFGPYGTNSRVVSTNTALGTTRLFITCQGVTRELAVGVSPPIG